MTSMPRTEDASPKSAATIDLVIIDTKVAIEPKTVLPAVGGQAASRGDAYNVFEAGDTQFLVGVWAGTPGTVRIDHYSIDELWCVIAGSITITNEAEVSRTFKAGDTFVMPQGFCGTAVITEGFRKSYAAFRAPEQLELK